MLSNMLADTQQEVTALAQFNKESLMEHHYMRESTGEGERRRGLGNWDLELALGSVGEPITIPNSQTRSSLCISYKDGFRINSSSIGKTYRVSSNN